MGFYDFMIENYINDETPLGDLARDMQRDEQMPEDKNTDVKIKKYLNNRIKDYEVKKIFRKAFELYLEYKKRE